MSVWKRIANWLFTHKEHKKPVNQIVQCKEQLSEFAKRLEKINRR